MEVKKWNDKVTPCDLCGKEFETTFIDGRTRTGHWALMCQRCHLINGVGLGTGRGQKYDAKTMVKLAG